MTNCIYYQDELGFCCLNGFDWDDFYKNARCKEEKYDTLGCSDKITVTEAKEMKDKLEAAKTHIKKEMEFHAPDINEGAWLNDHLESIMKILDDQTSTPSKTGEKDE